MFEQRAAAHVQLAAVVAARPAMGSLLAQVQLNAWRHRERLATSLASSLSFSRSRCALIQHVHRSHDVKLINIGYRVGSNKWLFALVDTIIQHDRPHSRLQAGNK